MIDIAHRDSTSHPAHHSQLHSNGG
jgi:hypothetical protein